MFKIINTETGEFSSGGTRPTWKKKGKTWSTLGAVKNHLSQRGVAEGYPITCTIVQYELTEVGHISMTDLCAQTLSAKVEREVQRKKQPQRYIEDYERRQLRELRAKYPDEV